MRPRGERRKKAKTVQQLTKNMPTTSNVLLCGVFNQLVIKSAHTLLRRVVSNGGGCAGGRRRPRSMGTSYRAFVGLAYYKAGHPLR